VSGIQSDQVSAQLLIDLINTYYLGDDSDVLAETGATQWLRDHTGHQGRNFSVAALAPLRQLREGLRQAALGNTGGHPEPGAVTEAEAVLRAVPVTLSLSEGVRGIAVRSSAREGSVENVLVTVARAYLSNQFSGMWPRIKVCAEPSCRWAFLDLSRNGSRRWCDMSGCGNRAKNRAWRGRQSHRVA
jgi:predicted RNA-binding Zn ribbon-like protein